MGYFFIYNVFFLSSFEGDHNLLLVYIFVRFFMQCFLTCKAIERDGGDFRKKLATSAHSKHRSLRSPSLCHKHTPNAHPLYRFQVAPPCRQQATLHRPAMVGFFVSQLQLFLVLHYGARPFEIQPPSLVFTSPEKRRDIVQGGSERKGQ